MYVSGKISVKAILENNKRDILKVYLLHDKKDDKDSNYIKRISNVPITYLNRDEMDALAQNKSHGGYLVEVGKRNNDDLKTVSIKDTVSLLLVEGVSDPFNLGEIMRTAYTLGMDGIISPFYDFYDKENVLIRASAGASEKLMWHQYNDAQDMILTLKNSKINIVSLYRGKGSIDLREYEIPSKVVFCIGGALRGLSRKILDNSDEFIIIDYEPKIALSAVGTADILSFETYRQKGKR